MSNDRTWFGDSTLGERFPAWTRGNAADVFPEPFSPLGQDLVLRQGMCTGLRDAYISIGALDYDEFDDPELPDLFKMFGGYPYNPLSMTRILGARMPGASPEMIDKAFFDERDEVPPYEEQPGTTLPSTRPGSARRWRGRCRPSHSPSSTPTGRWHAACARPDPTCPSSPMRRCSPGRGRWCRTSSRRSRTRCGCRRCRRSAPGALSAICEGLGDPTLSIRLLAGIEVDSAAPSHAMWELGRRAPPVAGDQRRVRRRARRGARPAASVRRPGGGRLPRALRPVPLRLRLAGPERVRPALHSWEVRPRIALAAIDLMRRSDESQAPADRNAAAVAERDRVAADIRAKIAGDAGDGRPVRGGAAVGAAVPQPGASGPRPTCVTVINEMRVALREFGRRLVERGVIDEVEQVFMVTNAELDQLRHDPDSFSR